MANRQEKCLSLVPNARSVQSMSMIVCFGILWKVKDSWRTIATSPPWSVGGGQYNRGLGWDRLTTSFLSKLFLFSKFCQFLCFLLLSLRL